MKIEELECQNDSACTHPYLLVLCFWCANCDVSPLHMVFLCPRHWERQAISGLPGCNVKLLFTLLLKPRLYRGQLHKLDVCFGQDIKNFWKKYFDFSLLGNCGRPYWFCWNIARLVKDSLQTFTARNRQTKKIRNLSEVPYIEGGARSMSPDTESSGKRSKWLTILGKSK